MVLSGFSLPVRVLRWTGGGNGAESQNPYTHRLRDGACGSREDIAPRPDPRLIGGLVRGGGDHPVYWCHGRPHRGNPGDERQHGESADQHPRSSVH